MAKSRICPRCGKTLDPRGVWAHLRLRHDVEDPQIYEDTWSVQLDLESWKAVAEAFE